MACNKLDRRLSSSFLLQRPIESVMKGSEQVRFQIQYLRAFSIVPLPSLRDRLQHALPNFCRQSHSVIRILVRECPARMSLYPRPELARDSYQLVVTIERLRLVVWEITRKDPIWVQFRARHPRASHLLLGSPARFEDCHRMGRSVKAASFIVSKKCRAESQTHVRTEHDCYPPYLQRLVTRDRIFF